MCKVELTQKEMVTRLAEVEAALNSRPIALLSPDPNDEEALTPVHLLIGQGLRSLPPESVGDEKGTVMKSWKRWRLLYGYKQTFWRALSRDYVPSRQNKVA